QAGLQPGGDAPRLLLAVFGQPSRGIGAAVFCLGVPPENQIHRRILFVRSTLSDRTEEYYPQTLSLGRATPLKGDEDGQGRRNLQNHRSDRNERNFVGGRREAGGPSGIQDFARPSHRGGRKAG